MKIALSNSENKCLTDSFEEQGIKSELLKKCLSAYYNGMHKIILDLMLIQTEIGSISKSTTEFSDHLDASKRAHAQVLSHVVTETLENAKKVSGAPGAVGLLLGVIQSSYEAAARVSELESELVQYFNESEKSALEKKIQCLLEKKEHAIETMKLIKDSFELLIKSIEASSGDQSEVKLAKELGVELNLKANNIGLELIENINTYISNIKDFSKRQRNNVDNQLSKHMISAYIPRGTFSASSLSAPHRVLAMFSHSRRKHSIKTHYRHNIGIREKYESPSLSTTQSKFITAILKRYPDSDYDPSSSEYLPFLTRIRRGIELVSKGDETTVNEDIELHTPLFLCQIDKAAHKEDSLYYLLNVRRFFFQSYPYGADKHIAFKDSFLHLNSLASKQSGDAKESYLSRINLLSTSILRYYANALLKKYLELPGVIAALFSDNISQKELLETVAQVINNELFDDTPSLYYRSPMAGLSSFLSALKSSDKIKDAIKLSVIDKNIEVTFAPRLSMGDESTTECVLDSSEIFATIESQKRANPLQT